MFTKDRMGRRGGGVLLYIKETIPAYEVQLQEETDCEEALWCNLVTGHTTITIGVVNRCPNITIQNNNIHNAISEVSKEDCIIMGDVNHGNIKWDSQQSTGVEDQTFLCLVQDNFLTQHVLERRRDFRRGNYEEIRKSLALIDWNDKMNNKTATECWNIFRGELDRAIDSYLFQ